MRLIDADALGVCRCSKDVLPAAYCAGWNGLINLLQAAPTVDATPTVRWIPVTERLPEYAARVLVTDVRAELHYVGSWTREKDPDNGSNCWVDCGFPVGSYPVDAVTHWAPLPEPPEVENAETE